MASQSQLEISPMRIIAGEFGGRTLLAPPDESTRPITDRAKQSLFDALGERPDGANVLDAFAGTGSMGLECLSRGASRVVFVERGKACERLRKNIATLGVETKSVILPVDAYKIGRHSALVGDEIPRLDLAFFDPPYVHTETGVERERLIRLLAETAESALAPGGLIILRHPTKVDVSGLIPSGFQTDRELTYGSMRVTWLTAI